MLRSSIQRNISTSAMNNAANPRCTTRRMRLRDVALPRCCRLSKSTQVDAVNAVSAPSALGNSAEISASTNTSCTAAGR